MKCNISGTECPYPDIIRNHVNTEEPMRADEAPELECATGRELSEETICGIAALACLDTAARINSQGVQHA